MMKSFWLTACGIMHCSKQESSNGLRLLGEFFFIIPGSDACGMLFIKGKDISCEVQ